MNTTFKRILLVAVPALLLAGGYKLYRMMYAPDDAGLRSSEPVLAAYHRDSSQLPAGWEQIRHLGLRWNNTSGAGVPDKLIQLWETGKPVLLTLEIWSQVMNRYTGQKNMLDQINDGEFDRKINELAAYLSKQTQPVWLRLNPEMEVHVDRYPWQMTSPAKYKASFQRIAGMIRKAAPGVKMVWAPAGYAGTEEYWPGKSYVDLVTVTLKSGSEGMTDKYPEEKSLTALITRKLHRTRFFDRPVLLLGSARLKDGAYRRVDFDSAAAYLQRYREVEYNMLDALDRPVSKDILRKDSSLLTGVYDPAANIVNDVPVQVEHLFVNLHKLKKGQFRAQADSAKKRGHALIVTMEPWKDKKLTKDPELIRNILSGRYDSVLENMYAVIKDYNGTVYLRWLHEMEIPITRYPWQSQPPLEYIRAYRYFVHFIRQKNPANIYFVWGPAGDRGSMEFYPGNDVVDYVSIAIYGLPDKNITDHRQQESFGTIFNRKYNRLWMSHKPIFITEFGISGPPDYKEKWLDEAANVVVSKKEINGISYFNDADAPKAWGDIEAPVWSITAPMYRKFLEKVAGK